MRVLIGVRSYGLGRIEQCGTAQIQNCRRFIECDGNHTEIV